MTAEDFRQSTYSYYLDTGVTGADKTFYYQTLDFGCIACTNYGTISNCSVGSGTIQFNPTMPADVEIRHINFGGIAGVNKNDGLIEFHQAVIQDCLAGSSSSAKLTISTNTTELVHIGGIVGRNGESSNGVLPGMVSCPGTKYVSIQAPNAASGSEKNEVVGSKYTTGG